MKLASIEQAELPPEPTEVLSPLGSASSSLPGWAPSRALDGTIDVPGPAIIGGDRQVPIAELVEQVLQVAGGGTGGLFRIRALAHAPTLLQAVDLGGTGHELPHAAGRRAGPPIVRRGQRLEAYFWAIYQAICGFAIAPMSRLPRGGQDPA